MKFTRPAILTKIEQKVRQKDQTVYHMITVLDKEDGKTIDCMLRSTEPIDFTTLKKMETYNVTFDLNVGRYTSLSITDLKAVK